MAGVRLLAMQLLCFLRSGYSALQEERLMSPLGLEDIETQGRSEELWAGRLSFSACAHQERPRKSS